MKILIAGNGKGAWSIRGQQLGAALGARVVTAPTETDLTWADVVVLIKKSAAVHAAAVHRAGKPIVWDALDFWSQPMQNGFTEPVACDLLRARIREIRPVLTIGATYAMAAACDGVYLPHHSWSGLAPTPAREVVRTVAYEGSPVYLGRWRTVLDEACRRRGWAFVVNPPNLADVDILVSFRDGQWDGWMCREWKSGVKVVNALAAGRPLIAQESAARRELGVMGSTIERAHELDEQLEWWSDYTRRQHVVTAAIQRAHQFTVSAVAAQYRQVLAERGLVCPA
jgi:hypothetical protein